MPHAGALLKSLQESYTSPMVLQIAMSNQVKVEAR